MSSADPGPGVYLLLHERGGGGGRLYVLSGPFLNGMCACKKKNIYAASSHNSVLSAEPVPAG